MIEMKNVQKIYRSGLLELHALSGFSLHIRKGEFVSIMGPSGAGKTTFLNIAGLLDTFDGGEYRLDGRDIRGLNDETLSRLRNQKIGFIFQSFNLLPDLNVQDNVEVPLRYLGLTRRERQARTDEALQQVNLRARMHHYPSELSGGQQQRVAIARALVTQPSLLLADEPTGNLDSLMARQLMEVLEQINLQGTTLVMVTHDPELAARASRRLHILDGRAIDVQSSGGGPTRVRPL